MIDVMPELGAESPKPRRVNKEWIDSRMTIEVGANVDVVAILGELNRVLGVNLQPRSEGSHLTIIGPTEKSALKTLTDTQINELSTCVDRIQRGQGVSVKGIGYIDGSSQLNGREADKEKKTAFIALDIPALNAFRASLDLPEKDFHITLGFEGGDIHSRIVSTKDDSAVGAKEVLAPVAKKANPFLSKYFEDLSVSFTEISGQEKRRAIEKAKSTEKKKEPSQNDKEVLRDYHLAQRARSVERFRSEIESAEITEREMRRLFLTAFEGSGVAEKLKLMDERGILEKVVPEFASNRHLTQDERWHEDETVGDHLIEATACMDDLIDESQAFSDPRFEKLLRLTAFFHDIGKNEDPDKSPGKKGKEGFGYRVEDKRKGEDFTRVRFLGHAAVGSLIAANRLRDLQSALTGDHQLSQTDIGMVALWVRHHMRAVDATRDLERADADELADRVLKDAYPVELLNERIPLREAVRASLLVQEMELRLSKSSKEKELWQESWTEVKQAIEVKLPVLESENKELLLAPLIEGGDLTDIGVPQSMRKAVRKEVFNRQKNGEIVTRAGALQMAIEIALDLAAEGGIDFQVDTEKIERVLGRGALHGFTMRMENLKAHPPELRDGYAVHRYEVQPIREFTQTTSESEIEQVMFSGNFPHLAKHVRENGLSTSAIKDLFVHRGFANMIQLEGFVKSHGAMGERLSNVKMTRSPLSRVLEVKRMMPHGKIPQKLVIEHGYQGSQDHTGSGSIHVGEQRLEALRRFYQRPEENDTQMLNRFFEEAVVHVAGTAPLEMPSHYDPERFKVLTGAVHGSTEQFASIILDTNGKCPRVETVLFHENKLAMKKDLIRKIKKLKEIQLPKQELDLVLNEANNLLAKYQIEPIVAQDMEQSKPQLEKKSKEKKVELIKASDLRAVGFSDAQVGAIMSKLRPELNKAGIVSPITLSIIESAKEIFDVKDINESVQWIVAKAVELKNASVPE